MITPRWYQTESVDALYNYFGANNGNPIIALPCGTGKSLVIAMFLHSVLQQYPYQRIVVGTHVKELISQDYKALLKIWPNAPAGIYSAGLKSRDLHAPITFAGIASLYKIIDAIGSIDLFIIDECHLLGPNADSMYMKVITALRAKNPFLKVIGLTATAWRTGMGMLTNGDIFTDIIYDICNVKGFRRLFDEGFLVPPYAKRMDNVYDVSEVKVHNGEFSNSSLNEAMSKQEQVTWAALNESINKNPDRKCRLVFCSGIDHAMLANDMLRYIGLRSEVVHSDLSSNERDDIMGRFFSGQLDALTNNGIATTGIDHPPIDHIISLRATMSVGLWVQKIGRGTRPSDGKSDCVVSDHSGNARRLGPIDDPYIPKMKLKGGGDAPVKICPACDTYNHASARVCVYCGEPFVLKVGFKEKAYDDVIVKSDLPQYETFNVEQVYYTQHLRRDALPDTKPTIKAVYQCGMQRFQEFIPIEAVGFGGRKAREWWRQRFPQEGFIPPTVGEAMHYIDRLIPPKAIKVWVNKKYPEITEYLF